METAFSKLSLYILFFSSLPVICSPSATNHNGEKSLNLECWEC